MKTTIENAITNIDDRFIDETITHMTKKRSHRKNVTIVIKKAVACAAATLVLLLGSVSVAVAGGNIQAYELVYSIYPDIAQKLVPVHKSCTDQGITMNVEAIHMDENTADIYISLQDLNGKLIDDSIDLFDSYSIHTNADQIGTCKLVSYDDVKKSATFLISIQQNGPIAGAYMKFSISKLLLGKDEITLELPQILLAEETDLTMKLGDVKLRGSGGVGNGTQNITSLLTANEAQYASPAPGAAITAYGFIDGKLHVQAYYEDILRYDNHGSVYLENGNETLYPVQSYSFWDEEKKGSYDEYIFDISYDDLQNYKIIGNFVTSQTLIEGNWQVSFPIENE